MLKAIIYLLPLSGEILLNNVLSESSVRVEAALLPESFEQDCSGIKQILSREQIPFRVPGSMSNDSLRDWIQCSSYDVGLSVGYDKKLPPWLINAPKHGTINIHPSLLPQYRGANPYFWVLRNREKKTGVTLHFMDEEFDTGPVIRQQTVRLESNDTMGSLFFLLNQLGVEMMMEELKILHKEGTTSDAHPQNAPDDLEPAPRVEDRHLRIDWSENTEDIDALVRAANPFFGAFTTFRGVRVHVHEIEAMCPGDKGLDLEPGNQPGSVVKSPDGPLIRCGDGILRLSVVQVEQLYTVSGKEFQKREKKAFEVLDKMI